MRVDQTQFESPPRGLFAPAHSEQEVQLVQEVGQVSREVWSEEEGAFDLMGVKASVSMNDKGSVLISHSTDGESFCHIGKLYCETTI